MQTEKIQPIHSFSKMEICCGTIQKVCDEQFEVLASDGIYSAERAFSCLVEPMVGDSVLFSAGHSTKCHVLSIIDRPDSVDANLSFPGNVTINSEQGKLNLNGGQGINIHTKQNISQSSEEYTLISKKAFIGVDSMTALGSKLVAKISNLQTYAESLETVAGNLLHKLKNSFRLIEGVDQTRSKDVISTVENLYSMQSKQASIIAKKDIKVDAERIHMG